MQQTVGRFAVAGDLAQLRERSIAQRVVPRAGIDPRIRFVGRDSHRGAPGSKKRRHALDMRESPLADLRPDRQPGCLKLDHQKVMVSMSFVWPTRTAPPAAATWCAVFARRR